jgi:8-oxo-dGTP pyrophosphatase MutT (NUDIX family)
MIFDTEPTNFKPKFEVVSCFCEQNGQILLLQRQTWKPQGSKWGVPAGKIDPTDKTLKAAVEREVNEETGIDLHGVKVDYFGKFFVRYTEFDFIYHIFHTVIRPKVMVKIRNDEHQQYLWVSPQDSLPMDLIEDLDFCIKLFYKLN